MSRSLERLRVTTLSHALLQNNDASDSDMIQLDERSGCNHNGYMYCCCIKSACCFAAAAAAKEMHRRSINPARLVKSCLPLAAKCLHFFTACSKQCTGFFSFFIIRESESANPGHQRRVSIFAAPSLRLRCCLFSLALRICGAPPRA